MSSTSRPVPAVGRAATGGAGRIFLVGLMGSGKSTVGRALADRLGRPYLDNDALLQQRTGLDAPALADLGRAALHDQESRQLHALLDTPAPYVAGIAASVADNPDDLGRIADAGRVVYLRATPATLARRVGRGQGRPWLGEDLLTTLNEMFAARDDAYRRVGQVVDTEGRDPHEIAAELARVVGTG
ncbi:shikimate kinase [Frankia torreyi]|uniref:Shikimate kinase n=1 Tax=Frankia torreyi TaxID=1856 RepID=A0A0D8BMD0_9ACTN|nr:shikimate kinase [Frankia torreyi]KQC37155.1 serine transporter [Frankia sp. ACN1ag]